MSAYPVTLDELHNAVQRRELEFYFQPKVSFLTGEVSGAEALLRWRRDNGALLEPDSFIPLAEASGYITTITAEMFPRLLFDMDHIAAESGDPLHMAFNISAQDLLGQRFTGLVDEAVGRRRVNGERLELEITEASVLAHEEAIEHNLCALVDSGIPLSMDDYGTGYSSLETLEHLPFSTLKVDQGFVTRMFESSKSATLVKATVAMAQMLGLKTVIEGIETHGAYAALLHSGGMEGQGYWLSKPLPREDFVTLLQNRRQWPASSVGLLRMAQLGHVWQHKMLMDMAYAYLGDESVGAEVLHAMHMDVSECVLGQWYYGIGQRFAGYPDFVNLEKPHRLMHLVCRLLCDSLSAGADRGAVADVLSELTRNATEVFASLERLETQALLEELH